MIKSKSIFSPEFKMNYEQLRELNLNERSRRLLKKLYDVIQECGYLSLSEQNPHPETTFDADKNNTFTVYTRIDINMSIYSCVRSKIMKPPVNQ
jgi:hypothetical protein